jgi:hypothetical protein
MSVSSLYEPLLFLPQEIEGNDEYLLQFTCNYYKQTWRKRVWKCRVQCPSNIRHVGSTRQRRVAKCLNIYNIFLNILYITNKFLRTKHLILDTLHQWLWEYTFSFPSRKKNLGLYSGDTSLKFRPVRRQYWPEMPWVPRSRSCDCALN